MADSDKPVTFVFNGILAVMTTATLAIMTGSLGYYLGRLDSIPKADQTIAQFGLAIERFDLIPQMTEFPDSP